MRTIFQAVAHTHTFVIPTKGRNLLGAGTVSAAGDSRFLHGLTPFRNDKNFGKRRGILPKKHPGGISQSRSLFPFAQFAELLPEAAESP
jgi:hypothetical protein